MKKNKIFKYIIAGILIAFALLTIFMSSSVLFDWFGIRAKEGNYVPFIVKTNLIMGILYLIAAYGFLKAKKWPFWLMLSAVLILLFAFAAFYIHIHAGGLYESKTIGAMAFRIAFTLIIAGLINLSTNKKI
ncbi:MULTISPECIES: hypothetical protein [Aequorivita]|uniref:DUF4345 domain-containing protein n=2 Tax=Aequorivita TaxID=153265 RepID=A0AB35YR42_9FLAO|nr:hypothetical protein [Aequorivita sp. Ant34-E75]WGF91597.1 hypothetical protein QCQ61_10295 [Aequorivita sp. Ant34-E75]